MQSAPCGLRGCKNGPSPFPGRMSYKATKPGFVCLSYLSMLYYCISNSSSSSSSRFVERITRTGESLMSIWSCRCSALGPEGSLETSCRPSELQRRTIGVRTCKAKLQSDDWYRHSGTQLVMSHTAVWCREGVMKCTIGVLSLAGISGCTIGGNNTGGSTPKSAGRKPTHLCQEVWRSPLTKLSMLQLQAVPVILGFPLPSDSAACGQDSGSRSMQPSSTLIFSIASFLCCYTTLLAAQNVIDDVGRLLQASKVD